MTWWAWIVLGLALAAIELATPGGFFILFFGIAALAIGALDLIGVAGPAWLQWLLFPVIAVIGLRLFRQPLLGHMRVRGGEVDSLVGEVAVTIGAIPAGQHGRAELRGSTWNARNVDRATLVAGQRCRVVAVQGLMLDILAE